MTISLAIESNTDFLSTHTLCLYCSLPDELPCCFPELSNPFMMHFSHFSLLLRSHLTHLFRRLKSSQGLHRFNNNIAETTTGFIDLLN